MGRDPPHSWCPCLCPTKDHRCKIWSRGKCVGRREWILHVVHVWHKHAWYSIGGSHPPKGLYGWVCLVDMHHKWENNCGWAIAGPHQVDKQLSLPPRSFFFQSQFLHWSHKVFVEWNVVVVLSNITLLKYNICICVQRLSHTAYLNSNLRYSTNLKSGLEEQVDFRSDCFWHNKIEMRVCSSDKGSTQKDFGDPLWASKSHMQGYKLTW